MRLNQNEVHLAGPCTWHRLYDFGGKSYSTLSMRIQIDRSNSVFVDVGVTTKSIEQSENKALISSLATKPIVYLVGFFANKKVKNKTTGVESEQIIIKSYLNSVGIQTADTGEYVNSYTVGGYIDTTDPLVVKVSYRNPQEDKTLYRSLPISLVNVNPRIVIQKGLPLLSTGKVDVSPETGVILSNYSLITYKNFDRSNYTNSSKTNVGEFI